ncbi:MAG: hypothetical protein IJX72_03835, partial [Clostridia bacterium]|nr:hypothetical protein [Clostridia bacterium]
PSESADETEASVEAETPAEAEASAESEADIPSEPEASAEEEAPAKAPKKSSRKSRVKTPIKSFGRSRAKAPLHIPPVVTWIVVGVLALAFVVLAIVAIINGFSLWNTPYVGLDETGYTVSVRFDANGGSFAGSPEEVYVVDVFNPADYADQSGKASIPLLLPEDPLRGNSHAFAVSKTNYYLAGWYRERTPRVNGNGEPLDAYGQLTSVSGREQGYVYSGKWDFENDRVEVDLGEDRSSANNEITLYAAWIPYFNFEVYSQGEDGTFTLVETRQLIELAIPEWNLTTGRMNMKEFPAIEGKTFVSAFLDEAMTVPAGASVSGSVDYETGTVTGDGTIRLYTTWMDGTWFRISTPKQFYDNSRLGGSYMIEADLDFTDALWPAAMTTGEFTGTIEGNGHAISNVTVLQGDNSKINGGLFGSLGETAKISDVSFENITYRIVAGSRMQAPNYGLLAGTVHEGATLENVTVTGTIEVGKDCYRPNDYNIGLLCGAGSIEGIDMSGITVTVEDPDNNTARVEVDPETGVVTLTFAD